jgi:hypothetical protein
LALALVMAAAGLAGADESRAGEAQFRRRAAAFKRLRGTNPRDNAWHRRVAAALRWFAAHQSVVVDGRHTCAELEERMGPRDPDTQGLDSWLPKRTHGGAAAPEVLRYEAFPEDDIGSGHVTLVIFCRAGKATGLKLDVVNSDG